MKTSRLSKPDVERIDSSSMKSRMSPTVDFKNPTYVKARWRKMFQSCLLQTPKRWQKIGFNIRSRSSYCYSNLALTLCCLFFIWWLILLLQSTTNDTKSIDLAIRNEFLPSTYGRFPTGSGNDVADDRFHIAMAFDSNWYNISISAIRSISYYSKHPITFHFLVPIELQPVLHSLTEKLPGDIHIVTYDEKLCVAPNSLVSFIAPFTAPSTLCRLFLAEFIPSDFVLYLDGDISAVSDIASCFLKSHRDRPQLIPDFGEEGLMAMAVDMGDVCQTDPDRCYPIGMKFRIPDGLECGTTPRRSKAILKRNQTCPSAGDYEAYQYNAGVILMNLRRMRSVYFTARLVQASIHTWQAMKERPAYFGDQDMVNNYGRLYPNSIINLPCGCNYQISGTRRESKCPNRPIKIAHLWSKQLAITKHKHDPFRNHFFFFQRNDINLSSGENVHPPKVPSLTAIPMDWIPPSDIEYNGVPYDVALRENDLICSHQSHICKESDTANSQKMSIDILSDKVYVLSKTWQKPEYFNELAKSIAKQSHPRITHIVGAQDSTAVSSYLKSYAGKVVKFESLYPIDPSLVCHLCLSATASCDDAPGASESKAYQEFADCVCDTTYPPNKNMNLLNRYVGKGWVLYVDDDRVFRNQFAISHLLANIKSRRSLVVFKSDNIDFVASSQQSENSQIIGGDYGASNFAFHTDNIGLVEWPALRCGDYWVAKKLSSRLPIEWINDTFVVSNPVFSAMNGRRGLVHRNKNSLVTVIITSYITGGWRPQWVRKMVKEYTSDEMQYIIHQVILVWNNPEESVPLEVVELEGEQFKIVRMKVNSLNNRWIGVLEYVETDMVLNLDDDVYVKRIGLLCMMNWYHREPNRMIAPFVRNVNGRIYVIDDLLNSGSYSLALPRVMMLSKSLLMQYSNRNLQSLHEYVDNQEAHCDDVLLNLVAQRLNILPLRVALQESSVVDFYSQCYIKNRNLTGGLALQDKRAKKRTKCVNEIMDRFGSNSMDSTREVGTCSDIGNSLSLKSMVEPETYKQMIDKSSSTNCEGK